MSFYLLISAFSVALGTVLNPPAYFFVLIALIIIALVAARVSLVKEYAHWRVLLIIAVALTYGFVWLQNQLNHRLPIGLDKTSAEVKLLVVERKTQPLMQRLLVKVQSSPDALASQGLPPLRYLQLNLYKTEPVIQLRSLINAEVVLRSPRNIANGLAFDYEAWLMAKGIDATGYILNFEVLSKSPFTLRQQFIDQQKARHSEPVWAWLAGLVFGEQDSFTPEQWQLAKQTGTLHLLVVSGLHMGLVLLLLVALWRVLLSIASFTLDKSLPYLILWRLLFLLLGSAGYLWLAGTGVALQRAWLMFAVLLVLHSTRLKLSGAAAVSFALLLVVVINPLVWTGAGFSYSFTAVLALMLFFFTRKTSVLETLWLPQWVVFLALFPVFLWWQQPISLVQCLTNVLAIPYVSFVLLPLSLLSLIVPDSVFSLVLQQAGEWYWLLLKQASIIPLYSLAYLPLLSLLLWPLFLMLLRRGVSYRLAAMLGGIIITALFVCSPQQKPVAKMIDVGQGQSLVFTTQQHTLVYDAGPYLGQFDTGEAIITPVLYKLGVRGIDTLIISHNDNDHAGGASALLSHFDVSQWWGGQSIKGLPENISLCSQAAERWHVLSNNLLYRYLSLDENAWSRIQNNNNNRSCVLQLDWYGTRFLLTGDVSKEVEYDLIRKYEEKLVSDVLVLGHHGSNTSSSNAFLRAVSPKQAWISSGFHNRFGHPNVQVLRRLAQHHIPWRNTAEEGAITLYPSGQVITEREKWQPPWRQVK